MSTKFFLNFYGYKVLVDTDWDDIALRLKRDFSFFVISKPDKCQLKIEINKAKSKLNLKEGCFTYKSSKVSFYEKGEVRYSCYNNVVDTEINFKTNEAVIFGTDINSVHEVSYLMILSRVGKGLDLQGLHRVHAGAWVNNDTLYLTLFSSGLGKSTLLTKVMVENLGTLYSDDSPLVSDKGDVIPFPLRIGFSQSDEVLAGLRDVPHYFLDRFRYGQKRLYSLEDLNWKIGGTYKRVVLLTATRGSKASFEKSLGLTHLKQLIAEGIIGIGLPILYEYFWEYGYRDFYRKVKLTLKRSLGILRLWFKAKKYKVTLESNPDKSFLMLKDLMKEN